tara:strand:- start:11124 stop:11915 length:792 start_codon:yes stop_codon:yes gene_type:complete
MIRLLIYLILFLTNISLAETLIIQSTTSTRDSGLYKYLLPYYPDYNNLQIKVIAVGTGQAIVNAKNCDGDILIVHDKEKEEDFLNNGYGIKRHNLMYNDFVIVGPVEDSANISNLSSASEVFSKIYEERQIFISRSDSSGTHSAEMKIWNNARKNPLAYSGQWYMETGQGMGPSLNIAISLNGYVFSDRSSWLRYNNKKSHKILYENREELKNNYGIILVNPERCPNINYNAANKLYEWLSSGEAAKLIKNYRLSDSNVFYID